jgi:hypothetical protein
MDAGRNLKCSAQLERIYFLRDGDCFYASPILLAVLSFLLKFECDNTFHNAGVSLRWVS